ncbi:MAG: ribonuclease HII [Holosporales bacterium]|jgi:ribonuclease HII|nr:ribonuclease HII [Holosporales bacterium]
MFMLSFEYGNQLEASFGHVVAGVDEVGRGPLAGPVVACAAAVLDQRTFLENFSDINDSKMLSKKRREQLNEMLKKSDCVRFAIESASPEEIDAQNIRNATFLAMTRALARLDVLLQEENLRLSSYIVDGNALPTDIHIPSDAPSFLRDQSFVASGLVPRRVSREPYTWPGRCLVKGDAKSYRIATASILAKVYRDKYMAALAPSFPAYGWERNAGYGTAQHLGALKVHGPTLHHRKTFAGVL